MNRNSTKTVRTPHLIRKLDGSFPFWIHQGTRIAGLLALLLFLFGLILFAYAGTYSRYWADDYCYSAWVNQLGIVPAIVDWYQTSGNRLSTLVAIAASEFFGPAAIRFVPLVVISLWVAAWAFFLQRLLRLAAVKAGSLLWAMASSLAMVYFAVLLAPDRLQTIYWRMGSFHYTLPIPIVLINLGMLLGAFHAGQWNWWIALGSGLAAFFAAGLSETFAAMQAGLFLICITWVSFFLRGECRSMALRLLTSPLVFTLLMMLIMMRAPANAWRQAVMPPPDNLLEIIPYSLRYAWDFIFYSVRGAPIPFLVFGMVMFSISLLAVHQTAASLPMRNSLLGVGFSCLAAYALVVCSFAPSAFAGLSYPAGRALMPGHAALLAGFAAAAFFLAVLVRQAVPQSHWISGLAIVLLLAGSLYPIRAMAVFQQDVEQLSARSARWDARTAEIHSAINLGQVDVQVRQTDVVQSLEDIGPDPRFWINACAAKYFGANSITANP